MAIKRRDLEDLLKTAIRERGGAIVEGTRVMSWERHENQWAVICRENGEDGALHLSDILVLADGRYSIGSHDPRPDPGWYGWNATFRGLNQRPGTLSLYFTRNGYVGTLTFPDGTTNVSGLVRRRKGEGLAWDKVYAQFLARNAAFGRLMKNTRQLSDWRGVGPLPFTEKPRRLNGVLLAGDAAGVGDPFMGEGIGRALGSGPLISRAFAESGTVDGLADTYTRLWEAAYADRFRLGKGTRLLLDRPWLAMLFLDLALRPGLIDRFTPLFHRGAGFGPSSLPAPAR